VNPPVSDSLNQRVPGIDVLRGLCILAVVVLHINIRIRLDNSSLGRLFPSTSKVLFWSGNYGVIVFFVISGFLITTWSLKRWSNLKSMDRRQFYLMRFARIAPCLLGLLLILSILDRAGVPKFTINTQHTSLPRALLAALTFHTNWLEAKTGYLPASWDVLWSLSVEEMFYLCFPLLCTWIRKELLLISLLCGLVVLGPFARTLTQNALWSDYGYFSCMDGIALGCLAAILAGKVRFSNKRLLALQISGTLLCILVEAFRTTTYRLQLTKVGLNVTVLELGTALLLMSLQQRFENSASSGHWSMGALRWFGRNSYEVYLTHMFVVWPLVWAFYYFHQSMNLALLWFLAGSVVAGLLGFAVAKLYSEPMNRRLRRKFMPRRQAAAAPDGYKMI
jgi:peptidoglycan/LPS O-acetylase OafA/YrhL